MESNVKKGWVVLLSGTGINLALGILYTWSVIKGGIPDSWGWSNADKALPYSIACIVFAIAMVPAGKLQDKIGPRWVASIGGLMTGIGCIIAAMSGSSLAGFVIGFGIFAGVGIGFGYSSATPPAVKWFPPQKTGMVAGIVVAGFGLASVYIAPLATKLLTVFQTVTTDAATNQTITEKGVSSTMLVFGIAFIIIVVSLSQLLKNPPEGHLAAPAAAKTGSAPAKSDMSWKEMLSTLQFYILWLMFFAGAAAGLTFISVAQDLGKRSLGELAFFAVVVLAIGNAGGRILAGMVSDKIGRQWTLFCAFMIQTVVVLSLYFVANGASWGGYWPIIMLIVAFVGANYGANLSLFPSVSKDYYGLKNYGFNYGILFTAWGAAGLVMPWVNGFVKDSGKPNYSYIIIICLLLTGAALTFVSRSLAEKK
jgi:MFS transporter, OFA family, oxalate/formate antiporter